MDRENDVARRDEVDLAAGQTGGVILGLHRLKREIQPVLRPRQGGATELARETLAKVLQQVQAIGRGTQRIVIVSNVHVEPQELAIAEVIEVDVGEVDPPVVSVGVEQPRGDEAQLTRLS